MPRERPSVHEIVVARRDPEVELDLDGGTGLLPLDPAEWRALADSDADLVPGDEEDTWHVRSSPEGPAVRWEDGHLILREDDEATIRKLVELSRRLGAIVVGEDGTEYFDTGLEDADAAPEASARPTGPPLRVPLDDELVRRRQAGLALIVGLGLPTVVGVLIALGRTPGPWVLAGLAGIAIAGMAVRALLIPRYVLEGGDGSTFVARIPETRSTSSDIAEKRIPRTELEPLELVWHALEYPAKTVREYHVRSARHSWLVFLSTTKPDEARTALSRVGRSLGVATEDRADGEPTKDVPARYRLSAAEKRKPRKRRP